MTSALTPAATIVAFDPQTATESDWVALNQFKNAMLAERRPEDPPHPVEHTHANLLGVPAFIEARLWIARTGDPHAIIGWGRVAIIHTGENAHLAQAEVEVLPAWRRQGLGRTLLAQIAAFAEAAERRLLLLQTYGTVPAGAAFAEHIGATVGLGGHTNQLDTQTLPPSLLAGWRTTAAARNPDLTLGLWEGPYPEAEIAEVARLMEITNHQPLGDLEIEDFHWTPDQIRQQDTAMQQRGATRWTLYARHGLTGALAGFTEVFIDPHKPAVLQQGFTAVWPHYRNRGLGRWLKAAMLEKVLSELPQVRWVRTDNADSNAAMLKINRELGFQPYQAESIWQVPLARVRQYLAE